MWENTAQLYRPQTTKQQGACASRDG